MICENCGHGIADDSLHAPDVENGVCAIRDKASGNLRGFARKGVYKDLYAKKRNR